jgi:F-type H+-transporting ATPase subunit epsilon
MLQLDVLLLSPTEVIFEGKAKSIILPGEQGVFEILPFHKRLLSRLISGTLVIDDRNFFIKRGVVKVNQNSVAIIVEDK